MQSYSLRQSRAASVASSSSGSHCGRPPVPLPRLSKMAQQHRRAERDSDAGVYSSLRPHCKPAAPPRQLELSEPEPATGGGVALVRGDPAEPKKERHPSVENPEYMSLIDFRSMAGMSACGDGDEAFSVADAPPVSPQPAGVAGRQSSSLSLTDRQMADLLRELDPLTPKHSYVAADSSCSCTTLGPPPSAGRQPSIMSAGTISLATTQCNSAMVTDEQILRNRDYGRRPLTEGEDEDAVYVNDGNFVDNGGEPAEVKRCSVSTMDLLDGLEFCPRGSVCPPPASTPVGQNICYSAWLWVQQLDASASASCSTLSRRPAKRWWCTLRAAQMSFSATDLEPDAPGKFLLDCAAVLYAGVDSSSTSANAAEAGTSSSHAGWLQRVKRSFDSVEAGECGQDEHNRLVLYYRNAGGDRALRCLKLIADSQVERDSWLMLIAKTCAPDESTAELVDSVTQTGYVWLRRGLSSPWRRAWALHERTALGYKFHSDAAGATTADADASSLFESDLRRVLRLGHAPVVDGCERCAAGDGGDGQADNAPVLLSFSGCSLYLQAEWPALTHRWLAAIAHRVCRTPLGRLDEQRLTPDDVPVVVDRCVDFIGVHGAMLEGVYRKSGPASQVRTLMAAFAGDPSELVLRKDTDECVFSVAEALRRYFRQLDQPLFTFEHRSAFYDAFAFAEADLDGKIAYYKEALGRLPRVNYATLRKLAGHLREIAEHSAVNKATVSNIAKIFGPTLMTVDKELESSTGSSACSSSGGAGDYSHLAGRIQDQIRVVFDLIANYNAVFDVSAGEIEHRARVQRQLGELQQVDGCFPKKPAGGMLVPIHVFEKENQAFNIQTSNSAQRVLDFAVSHRSLPADEGPYALMEAARDGQLERLVWPEERLLDVCIARWYRWTKEIASLYLIVKVDTWTRQLADVDPYPFAVDVRFADKGSRHFKKASFQLAQGQLCLHKDNKLKHVSKKWPAENLLWYFGCETKRDPPTPHSVTFADGAADSPSSGKFFGQSVCFHESADLLRFLAAVFSSAGH